MRPTSLLRWAVTICYAAGIFYLSSRPWSGLPAFPYLDKVVHLGLYGGLGSLCAWSLSASMPLPRRTLFLIALGIAVLYGLSDEVHQMYVPGRSAEMGDLAADALGGALGAFLALVLVRRPAAPPGA